MLHNYLDLLTSLHSRKAKYVIIGGVAAVTHGVARTTYDLDIFIEATVENAQKVLDAMIDVRYETARMTTAERLITRSVTICNDRNLVDIMTKVPGLRFHTAWKNKVSVEYEGVPFYLVSKRDLIRSKRKANRPIDQNDVLALTGMEYDEE